MQFRNNAKSDVVGVSDIRIIMHNIITRTLTRVRCDPKFKKNLISLIGLDSYGCPYTSKGEILNIIQGVLVIMRGIKQSGSMNFNGRQ